MPKTVLCERYFKKYSGATMGCHRGAKCFYAHDVEELRLSSGSPWLHARIVFDGEDPPPGHEWVQQVAASANASSSADDPMPRGVKRAVQTAFLSNLIADDEAKIPLLTVADLPPTLVWSNGRVKFYLAGVSAVRSAAC